MGKLKFDRIKKAIAILLAVFFVVSATAVAVSARTPSPDVRTGIFVQNNIASTPTISTGIIVSTEPGDIRLNVDARANVDQENGILFGRYYRW